MCSGEFPLLAEACPGVIQPIWILRGAVGAAARDRKLGLIGPAEDLPEAPAQWRPYVPDVICAAASPSDPLAAAQAAGRDLAARGARLVYLDCMGFTEEHRAAVRDAAACRSCAPPPSLPGRWRKCFEPEEEPMGPPWSLVMMGPTTGRNPAGRACGMT